MSVPTGPTGPPPEVYHFDLSTSGRVEYVEVGKIRLRLSYYSSTDIALRIELIPPSTTPIPFDFRRAGMFDAAGVQALGEDNGSLTTTGFAADSTIHNRSNDNSTTWLRQQDPVTKTWSLCEYKVFVSNRATRVTVWVNWIYQDVVL